jgi:hypothetical protein
MTSALEDPPCGGIDFLAVGKSSYHLLVMIVERPSALLSESGIAFSPALSTSGEFAPPHAARMLANTRQRLMKMGLGASPLFSDSLNVYSCGG